jgi:Flp pilus assembly protein TadB
MITLLVLAALASAAAFTLAGVTLAEQRDRNRARKQLDDAAEAMKRQLADVAAVHNGLATRFSEMQDQLNAHEMRLSGLHGKSTPWPTAREMSGPTTTSESRGS